MCVIHYQNNCLNDLANVLKNYITEKQSIYILSDNNVSALYLSKILKTLKKSYKRVYVFTIKAGEQSKSLTQFEAFTRYLITHNAQRNSIIINLGGGVVSDLGGFVAASYMRGINYINIPTTILAQIDASIGGKTAINFHNTKNIVGAFHKPLAVIIDTSFIQTLPQKEQLSGWGELFKYFVLTGDFGISGSMPKINSDDYITITQHCINYKQKLVKEDLHDKGLRQILNLGHTAGHGLEITYKLPHGIAVAVGILVATEISRSLNLCTKELKQNIYSVYNNIFSNIHLPVAGEINKLFNIIKSDKKKTSHNSLNFILPIALGKVIIKEVKDDIWQKQVELMVNKLKPKEISNE